MLCFYLFLADFSPMLRKKIKQTVSYSLFTYVTLSKGRVDTKKEHFKENKLPAGTSWRLKNANPTQGYSMSLCCDNTSGCARPVLVHVHCPTL